MATSFHIVPECRELFQASGLNSFAALMNGSLGEMVSCPRDRRKLYRFTLAGEDGQVRRFYLKRMRGEPVPWLLKVLFLGRRPHCGPVREMQLLAALDRAGFAVMSPVAWGEESRLGMPVGGFLVVREVSGRDLADLCETLGAAEKTDLLREVGNLVGSLHASGFFQPVRLKDLIREETTGRLVMIDRETSKPWAGGFSRQRAIAALARTARRTLRDGHRFGPGSIRCLLAGYVDGVAPKWPVTARDLRRLTLARLRREMA